MLCENVVRFSDKIVSNMALSTTGPVNVHVIFVFGHGKNLIY